MKKLLCLMGGAVLFLNVSAQEEDLRGRIFINSRLPDINLGDVINYKDSTASLSDFKNKLIILDFWFLGCSVCIAQFPIEDSLQKQFENEIQIIPVTFDPAKDVESFLESWSRNNNAFLDLPFVVADTVLNTFFKNIYFPHYIWIAQDRRVIGHTSEHFLTAENIRAVLNKTNSIKRSIEKDPEIPNRGMNKDNLFKYYFKPNSAK